MRTHTPDPDVFHLTANGLNFACLQWGDPDAPLALLVHGFPDTARTWDLVGPRVAAAGFRVVAPYTRGIAPTAIPADAQYDADTLGRDILGLIEACGVEQAVVVGHDFGAGAAYAAVGLGPERIRKLVTVAIPHLATIKPRLGLLWGARHFVTHRLPGAAARFAKSDHAQIRMLYERWSPTYDWPDSELESAKNSYAAPGSGEAAIAYYKFTSAPSEGFRGRVAVPTRIIGGHDDGVATEEDFEASRRKFTGDIDVVMVPGGHFLHREHPEAFLDVLLPFLTAD